jgi:SAM-dependent methyltransferase
VRWLKPLKLDIGCGHHQTGDVNVDPYIQPTLHRTDDQRTLDDRPIAIDRSRHFIVADGCHLPFRDNTFDEVYSSHVIEHVKNPMLFLKECVRVSRNIIKIKCPHRYDPGRWKKPLHINHFNRSWFVKAFKTLGCDVFAGGITGWAHIPNIPYFLSPFRLPAEIEITARKVVK